MGPTFTLSLAGLQYGEEGALDRDPSTYCLSSSSAQSCNSLTAHPTLIPTSSPGHRVPYPAEAYPFIYHSLPVSPLSSPHLLEILTRHLAHLPDLLMSF